MKDTLPTQWKKQQREQLRAVIEYYGSQIALAKIIGVEKQVVGNWKARGRMSATMAEKLEEITEGRFKKRDLRPDVVKWWSEK